MSACGSLASSDKRFTDMLDAFGDAMVTGWEGVQAGIFLPDEDDRHVEGSRQQVRACT